MRPTPGVDAPARSRRIDLLLPWKRDPLGREAGVQRDGQLAAGAHVEVRPSSAIQRATAVERNALPA